MLRNTNADMLKTTLDKKLPELSELISECLYLSKKVISVDTEGGDTWSYIFTYKMVELSDILYEFGKKIEQHRREL